MKSIWKGLIIGIVLIAIGAGILITTLAVNGWAIETKYTMETFTAKEDNNYVELDIGACALKTEFFDGEKIEISYPSNKRFNTDITETNGKLTFKSKVKWFAQFWGSIKIPETVVKLPKAKVFDLTIDLGAGSIHLEDGVYGNVKIDVGAGKLDTENLECNSLVCDISAGSVNFKSVACSSLICDLSAGKLDISSLSCPDIKADVSAGKLNLGINGVKSEYTIRSSVSAGNCNLTNQTGTTTKMLVVDCSAGTITVSFND